MSCRDKIQCTIGGVPGEYELTCAIGDHAVTLSCLDEDDLLELQSCIDCILESSREKDHYE